jgi:hypothetical protein
VVLVAVVVMAIMIRDSQIQSHREAVARLIATYEQNVQKADDDLLELEAESIAFEDLDEISSSQLEILRTSKLLIGLAPVINSPDKVNRYSQASVDSFNRYVNSYNRNVRVYQSQMSVLNGIVDRANKQYEIKIVTPATLNRASLRTEKKFLEIIGFAQTPELGPSSRIEEVNRGIVARSETQKSIRDRWNNQAGQINETNRNINELRAEILDLYGTRFGGINVEEAIDVKTGT